MNAVDIHGLALAFLIGLTFFLGLSYEIAGMTVPGWHTISYSAHRSWIIRGGILSSVAALFIVLAIHFAGPISR